MEAKTSVKADVASGDSGRQGQNLGSWNPLFASLHYFGEEGLAGPTNFFDFHPEAELHPTPHVRVNLSTNWFWRQKLTDGIYLPGPILLLAPAGSRARYVGNLSAVEAEWGPSPHWVVTAYYSHFDNGAFVRQSRPSSESLNYIAGWITFHF